MTQRFETAYKIVKISLISSEQCTTKPLQMLLCLSSASGSVWETKHVVTVPKVTEEESNTARDWFSVHALGGLWRVPIKFKNESISCRNLYGPL